MHEPIPCQRWGASVAVQQLQKARQNDWAQETHGRSGKPKEIRLMILKISDGIRNFGNYYQQFEWDINLSHCE